MLVRNARILREHGIKSFVGGAGQQLAVLDPLLPQIRYGDDLMPGQEVPEIVRQVLVQKQLHPAARRACAGGKGATSRPALAMSSTPSTCSRVTVGNWARK